MKSEGIWHIGDASVKSEGIGDAVVKSEGSEAGVESGVEAGGSGVKSEEHEGDEGEGVLLPPPETRGEGEDRPVGVTLCAHSFQRGRGGGGGGESLVDNSLMSSHPFPMAENVWWLDLVLSLTPFSSLNGQ